MSDSPKPMRVRILDKEYLVACDEKEQDDLVASARFLDEKMREIRAAGRIVGTERIAVMAALNIVHELLRERGRGEDLEEGLSARLISLQERIDQALNRAKQLEL